MTVAAFLRDLEARDILISLKGESLAVDAPAELITDELRAQIASRKPEILSFLRAAQGPGQSLVLTHVPAGERVPLSSAQQRLWFLNQLDPDETVYNMGLGIKIAEPVDLPALERALVELANRHAILRTVFADVDGDPSQVVTEIRPELAVVDLGLLPEPERASRLELERRRLVHWRFRLAERPPFQATLIRNGTDRAWLVTVMHHILADGWSLGLLAEQLHDLYQQILDGTVPAPAAPEWQYADYAYSQQEWLRRESHDADIGYWKRKLSGELARLDLPFDHPRAAVLSSNGATHSFRLSSDSSARLRALGHQSGTTLFTVLLAVYEILLHRYSGQPDILIGTPVANRPLVELEQWSACS